MASNKVMNDEQRRILFEAYATGLHSVGKAAMPKIQELSIQTGLRINQVIVS